ncbi:acrosin-like [Phoenix dactylifera]|uniref:Acrosin-like n=1 Tax=Phoenix dactylifera TaxID=42345 RepID=A0A8B7C2R3_PHODC|nr:acrosin-like [Phoenix dactylifera]
MAIPETLYEWRYHLLTAALGVAAAVGILHILPSFLTILGFFAPLLMSTALVLWTVPIIARYSQKPPEAAAGVVGRDMLDFVAAGHEELPLLMPEELAPPPLLLDQRPPPLMPVEEIAPPQPPMKETPPPPPVKETPPLPPPVKEMPPPPSDEAAKHPESL